jgi:hypothetical protein
MPAASHCEAAAMVKSNELHQKEQWIQQRLLGSKPQLPFSLVYGGQASKAFLVAWKKKAETRKLDDARIQHTLTWTDPKTGLELQCVAVEYRE